MCTAAASAPALGSESQCPTLDQHFPLRVLRSVPLFPTPSLVPAFASGKGGRNGPCSFICLEKSRNIFGEITGRRPGRVHQRRSVRPAPPAACQKPRKPVRITLRRPRRPLEEFDRSQRSKSLKGKGLLGHLGLLFFPLPFE